MKKVASVSRHTPESCLIFLHRTPSRAALSLLLTRRAHTHVTPFARRHTRLLLLQRAYSLSLSLSLSLALSSTDTEGEKGENQRARRGQVRKHARNEENKGKEKHFCISSFSFEEVRSLFVACGSGPFLERRGKKNEGKTSAGSPSTTPPPISRPSQPPSCWAQNSPSGPLLGGEQRMGNRRSRGWG
jgi:hypothetical protein